MKSSILAAALVASLGLDKKPEDVTAAINAAIAADKKTAEDKAAKDALDKAAADKAALDADLKARDKAAADAGCTPEEMVKGEDGNWGLGAKAAKDEDIGDLDAEDVKVGAGSIANTLGKPAQDKAMDAAIKTATDAAVASERALQAAREEVKPLLGNVALDTADAVYGAALDHLNVDHKDVHPTAWRALFQAATKQTNSPVSGDAKSVKTMDEAFPHINRLRR